MIEGMATIGKEYKVDFDSIIYGQEMWNEDQKIDHRKDIIYDRNGSHWLPLEVLSLDMVLDCPKCGLRHVDKPEPDICRCGRTWADHGNGAQGHEFHQAWDNPPHHKHLCAGCSHLWTPYAFQTNGVESE